MSASTHGSDSMLGPVQSTLWTTFNFWSEKPQTYRTIIRTRGGKYLARDDLQPTLVRRAAWRWEILIHLRAQVVHGQPRRIDVEDFPKEETVDA